MKTGLGLFRKYRILISYINLFRFNLRKYFIGFDYANNFIRRVDKYSIQLILKKNGAIIGKNCDIETGLTFHNCKSYSNLIIGNNCHIGKDCFFDLRDRVEIGNNVVISMLCNFITHIDMNKSELSIKYPATRSKIKIKDHTYVGANVTILMGITLNENVFVGANSLIKDDVEKYTMVGGVPTKVIRKLS